MFNVRRHGRNRIIQCPKEAREHSQGLGNALPWGVRTQNNHPPERADKQAESLHDSSRWQAQRRHRIRPHKHPDPERVAYFHRCLQPTLSGSNDFDVVDSVGSAMLAHGYCRPAFQVELPSARFQRAYPQQPTQGTLNTYPAHAGIQWTVHASACGLDPNRDSMERPI